MGKFITSFIFLVMLCTLAACKPLPSAILQEELCSPPCWKGITPGITLVQELNEKLESFPEIDAKSIKAMYVLQPNDSIDFKFLPNMRREEGGRIYLESGVVRAISLSPKSNLLLLPEVLQKWGPPDQYISIYYSKAETPYLTTSVVYTKQGIILVNIRNMRSDEIPRFDSGFPILSVWYTNPASITILLENGLIDTISPQDILDGLKPWNGLGEIYYINKNLSGR